MFRHCTCNCEFFSKLYYNISNEEIIKETYALCCTCLLYLFLILNISYIGTLWHQLKISYFVVRFSIYRFSLIFSDLLEDPQEGIRIAFDLHEVASLHLVADPLPDLRDLLLDEGLDLQEGDLLLLVVDPDLPSGGPHLPSGGPHLPAEDLLLAAGHLLLLAEDLDHHDGGPDPPDADLLPPIGDPCPQSLPAIVHLLPSGPPPPITAPKEAGMGTRGPCLPKGGGKGLPPAVRLPALPGKGIIFFFFEGLYFQENFI